MSENVIAGTFEMATRNAEGQLLLTIVVDNEYDLIAKNLLKGSKAPVALVRMTSSEVKDRVGPYQDFSHKLVESGWFANPGVYEKVGTDNEYLEWLKLQPCAHRKVYGHEGNPIVPAHVRRVSRGSGMAHKPEYSAIPLNNFDHQRQHLKGESSVRNQSWWEEQAKLHLQQWAIIRFVQRCGLKTLSHLSPSDLENICEANDLPRPEL